MIVESVEAAGPRLRLGLSDLASATERVLSALSSAGAVVTSLRSETPRLEEIFLSLTGRDLRDG